MTKTFNFFPVRKTNIFHQLNGKQRQFKFLLKTEQKRFIFAGLYKSEQLYSSIALRSPHKYRNCNFKREVKEEESWGDADYRQAKLETIETIFDTRKKFHHCFIKVTSLTPLHN